MAPADNLCWGFPKSNSQILSKICTIVFNSFKTQLLFQAFQVLSFDNITGIKIALILSFAVMDEVWMNWCLLLVSIFCLAQAQASEPDNFTVKPLDIHDSKYWLNEKMNRELQYVADETKSCDQFELQKKIFKSLGGVFVAKIERWSEDNPNTYFLPIENSIYSDITKIKGVGGLRKLFDFSIYYTPGLMRINDTVFGEDKLGHFLQLGYSMYFAVQRSKDHHYKDIRNGGEKFAEYLAHDYEFIKTNKLVDPLDIVAAYADFQENGQWGMKATLVKSYADMSANYYGYLFWNELIDGNHPYFKCQNNHFVKTREFNFEEYVNPSWDESINCSEFHPKIKAAIENKMKASGLSFCPVRKNTCSELVKKIGPISSKILHPKCLESAKGNK